MARFLAIDARIKRLSGDWQGSANDGLDCIRFGSDIPHGSPLIGMLVGIAIAGIGQDSVAQTIDHLDAAQARAAARRLEDVDRRQTAFADVLQEEEWGTQASLLELFQSTDWRQTLTRILGNQSFFITARMYTTSKRQFLDDYTHYTDAEIATAKLPYATALAVPAPPLPNDLFTRSLVSIYSKAREKDAECQAKNDLLMLEFALHAYRLEHGSYPVTLEKLTPVYLESIPSDPFGTGESLHYQRTGKGYKLYSCGPNGKDDHGSIDDIVVKKP